MFPMLDRSRTLQAVTATAVVNSMSSMRNACPAWALRAWPPLLWQVSREIQLQLQHVGTQVIDTGDGVFRTAGQTLWACQCAEGDAGMAWDWIELGQGVVAMADPLAVVTNLRLVGHEGEKLDRYESARRINQIVHQLPWQTEVERVLSALASQQTRQRRTVQRPATWQRLGHTPAH